MNANIRWNLRDLQSRDMIDIHCFSWCRHWMVTKPEAPHENI